MSIKSFLIALFVGVIVMVALKLFSQLVFPIADFKHGLFVGLTTMAVYYISEDALNKDE